MQIGVGHTLRGKTLGNLRLRADRGGRCRYGKAFGMKVLVWAREAALAKARADGYETASSKADFFERCDGALAAYAAGRRHPRHRQGGRSHAHEADGASWSIPAARR